MSTAGDVISVVKNILLVKENLDRLSDAVAGLSDDIRDHERRLIRIETTLDLSAKRSRLILPGE